MLCVGGFIFLCVVLHPGACWGGFEKIVGLWGFVGEIEVCFVRKVCNILCYPRRGGLSNPQRERFHLGMDTVTTKEGCTSSSVPSKKEDGGYFQNQKLGWSLVCFCFFVFVSCFFFFF